MSSTKCAGRSVASICRRNVICGWQAVTTIGARSSSPSPSTTPVVRPSRIAMRSTIAFVRISAPAERALRSIAAATAPIPPSGTPHDPSVPSPTSPIEWCAMT
jgi:hypothetical protein